MASKKVGRHQARRVAARHRRGREADIGLLVERIKKAHTQKIILVEKETEAKIRAILGSKAW